MHPTMGDNLENLLYVIITCDDIWDPTLLNHSIDPSNDTYHHDMDPHIDEEEYASLDDHRSVTGNYLHHDNYGPDCIWDVYHNEHVTCSGFDLNTADNSYHLTAQCMIKDQDYKALCPYQLWLPLDHIKHTLATTTQWFHNAYHIPFHKHFKSNFPAANVSCHNEPITTNTMFLNKCALGSNAQAAQFLTT